MIDKAKVVVTGGIILVSRETVETTGLAADTDGMAGCAFLGLSGDSVGRVL